MYVCKRCKRELDDDKFYKDIRMLSGHLSFCKECVRARVLAYQQANLERIRLYDRDRGQLPHRVAARLEYKATKPLALKLGRQAWTKRNPEKIKAQAILWNALRTGKIMKPKVCEKCGAKGRIEAHHPNYAEPLVVLWLCSTHHRAEHGR